MWDNCSNYLLDKLQKMQNRAARVITGKPYEVRSAEILKELGWQPLVDRRKQKKNIFMYKIKNNNHSECMTTMFNTSKNKNYNHRNNDVDFAILKPNTNFLKRSISYSGVNLWNDLPKCAKEKQISIRQFKVILNREN